MSPWAVTYARRRVEAEFTSMMQLRRAFAMPVGVGTLREGLDQQATTLLWQGRGRIRTLDGSATRQEGDQVLAVAVLTVSLPITVTNVRRDDFLDIIDCPTDEFLVGRTGMIESVDGGGQGLVRTLGLIMINPSSGWHPQDGL